MDFGLRKDKQTIADLNLRKGKREGEVEGEVGGFGLDFGLRRDK